MKRRLLSALLVLSMLFSMVMTTAVSAADSATLPFTDVESGKWYYDAVSYAYTNGLMEGKGDNKFQPTASMTRAEAVTILARLANFDDLSEYVSDSNFTDVDTTAEGKKWYAGAVGWAVHYNVVNGYEVSEGTYEFRPNQAVKRDELATMIVGFLNNEAFKFVPIDNEVLINRFNDRDTFQTWAKDNIDQVRKWGLFGGDDNKNFNPKKTASRAEIATILQRFPAYDDRDVMFSAMEAFLEECVCIAHQTVHMVMSNGSSFSLDQVRLATERNIDLDWTSGEYELVLDIDEEDFQSIAGNFSGQGLGDSDGGEIDVYIKNTKTGEETDPETLNYSFVKYMRYDENENMIPNPNPGWILCAEADRMIPAAEGLANGELDLVISALTASKLSDAIIEAIGLDSFVYTAEISDEALASLASGSVTTDVKIVNGPFLSFVGDGNDPTRRATTEATAANVKISVTVVSALEAALEAFLESNPVINTVHGSISLVAGSSSLFDQASFESWVNAYIDEQFGAGKFAIHFDEDGFSYFKDEYSGVGIGSNTAVDIEYYFEDLETGETSDPDEITVQAHKFMIEGVSGVLGLAFSHDFDPLLKVRSNINGTTANITAQANAEAVKVALVEYAGLNTFMYTVEMAEADMATLLETGTVSNVSVTYINLLLKEFASATGSASTYETMPAPKLTINLTVYDPMHDAMDSILDNVTTTEDNKVSLAAGTAESLTVENLEKILLAGMGLDAETYSISIDQTQFEAIKAQFAAATSGDAVASDIKIAVTNKTTGDTTEAKEITFQIAKDETLKDEDFGFAEVPAEPEQPVDPVVDPMYEAIENILSNENVTLRDGRIHLYVRGGSALTTDNVSAALLRVTGLDAETYTFKFDEELFASEASNFSGQGNRQSVIPALSTYIVNNVTGEETDEYEIAYQFEKNLDMDSVEGALICFPYEAVYVKTFERLGEILGWAANMNAEYVKDERIHMAFKGGSQLTKEHVEELLLVAIELTSDFVYGPDEYTIIFNDEQFNAAVSNFSGLGDTQSWAAAITIALQSDKTGYVSDEYEIAFHFQKELGMEQDYCFYADATYTDPMHAVIEDILYNENITLRDSRIHMYVRGTSALTLENVNAALLRATGLDAETYTFKFDEELFASEQSNFSGHGNRESVIPALATYIVNNVTGEETDEYEISYHFEKNFDMDATDTLVCFPYEAKYVNTFNDRLGAINAWVAGVNSDYIKDDMIHIAVNGAANLTQEHLEELILVGTEFTSRFAYGPDEVEVVFNEEELAAAVEALNSADTATVILNISMKSLISDCVSDTYEVAFQFDNNVEMAQTHCFAADSYLDPMYDAIDTILDNENVTLRDGRIHLYVRGGSAFTTENASAALLRAMGFDPKTYTVKFDEELFASEQSNFSGAGNRHSVIPALSTYIVNNVTGRETDEYEISYQFEKNLDMDKVEGAMICFPYEAVYVNTFSDRLENITGWTGGVKAEYVKDERIHMAFKGTSNLTKEHVEELLLIGMELTADLVYGGPEDYTVIFNDDEFNAAVNDFSLQGDKNSTCAIITIALQSDKTGYVSDEYEVSFHFQKELEMDQDYCFYADATYPVVEDTTEGSGEIVNPEA